MQSQSERTAAGGAKPGRLPVAAALVLVLVAAGACASDEEAGEIAAKLGRASTAVDVASTADTRRFAAAELAIAEEKLNQARNAARAEEYERADHLISEGLVNAQLATAKAEAARIRAEIDGMKAPPAGAAASGRR